MPSWGLAAALSAGLCVIALAVPEPVQAQVSETQFNVPPGQLKAVLDSFSRQAGVPIIYRGNEMVGVRSGGYRGRAAPRVALAAVLRGTGFRMHVDSSGAIAVVRVRERAARVPQPGGADAVRAQVEPPPPPQDIVVTGTRILRNGYDAPTPTTVVERETIEGKAPITIIDALVSLPVFRNSATPSTAGVAQSGPSGQSFVNLRGLGATRTLVLLDGQRFVPSTSVGTVDIGILPGALVERIDIVTGGASAAYGSDAVAGVVNFVLDNRLSGISGSLEGGVTAYGDNRNVRATLNVGTSFAGRGHLVASAEVVQANGVPMNARPDTEYPVARLLSNAAWTPDNEQFRQLILPYVYTRTASLGGVIVGGPLGGIEFGPGGEVRRQPQGAYSGTSAHALGGRFDDQAWDFSVTLSSLPQEKATGYARISWDLGDGLSAYASGIAARNAPGPFHSSPANTLITGNFIVLRDNAFLPEAIRLQMEQLDLETISVGRYSEDLGASLVSRSNRTARLVAGLRGPVGSGWTVDAYAQYGENRQIFQIARNAIRTNIALAADAVDEGLAIQGTANGRIVCRSTLADPANGCIPLNIFGPMATRSAPASPAAAGYILGTSRAELHTEQRVAAVSFAGTPLTTPAGPVSLVLGGEMREDSARQETDPLSAAGAFGLGNPRPLSGRVGVKEVFAEAVVPLVAEQRAFSQLDLNGALRLTDYSTSGSVATWKLGLTWQPVDAVRLRATRSRDIRAPNIVELFSTPVLATATAADPFTNTNPTFQVSSLGNPGLSPEKADTVTAGVVVRPSAVPGLELALDYYSIDVERAIATLSPADIVGRCFRGSSELCHLITRVSGAITQIDNPYLNLNAISTAGLDFEMSYRRHVGRGTATARVLANRVQSYVVSDGVTTIDRAGDLNTGQPKFEFNAGVGYRLGDLGLLVDVTHIGGGSYDTTFVLPTDTNDNTIPARTYLGLHASVELGASSQRRELFFNVANLFNVRPPPVFVFSGGPNYERVGRAFRAGFRFAF